MPDTTLYFVRHGETEPNRLHIMQGRRIDASLNDAGRRQAEALAARFAEIPLDAIYTSALRRTHETAAPIAAIHDHIPVHRLADLDEMSWGVYEGEGRSPELRRMLDTMYKRWGRGEYHHRVEEGESILDVQERGMRAIEHIIGHHVGETVLVVSHGRFLRVILATLLVDYGLERMDDLLHENTCVNHLVFDGSRYEQHLLNCTAHLNVDAAADSARDAA